MRIFIIGASGFIGGRIAAQLANAGHEVAVCGRDPDRLRLQFLSAEAIACDFATDSAADWRARLTNADAVVNAAGIFRARPANSFAAVHVTGPRALFEACAAERIPKLIQISALGAGAQARTPFHLTKREADDCCMTLAAERNLGGWTVVRPSLVIGQGGQSSALFAALAALPWPPRLGDGTWTVQPVHVADLAYAVRLLLENDGSAPPLLDLAGPAPMTTDELTLALRRWLGLPPAHQLPLPEWALRASIPLARALSFDALSKDSLTMLAQGNTAPVEPLAEALGWTPRAIDAALASEPATEADLWHARLLFLRPALRIGLALIWIATAIVSAFVFPLEKSMAMVAGLGVSGWQAAALVYGGAAVDGILGLALLLNIRPATIGLLQLATVAVFTILACFTVPQAWIDPLGPMTKNIAVVLATLVMIAMEAKR
ncbi:MAG: SDR family oxidoreductase [Rhodomicrobium sp.]